MKLILLFLLAAVAHAQIEPAPLIHVQRWAGREISGGFPPGVTVLGMTSFTGPAETWTIAQHDSFGSIEDAAGYEPADPRPEPYGNDALDNTRSMIALYRPGWSYRPEQAIRQFPKARYFQVSIYRVAPGGEAAFYEYIRVRKGSLDAINLDRADIAYQVFSGSSAMTCIFLSPLPSLRAYDEGLARFSVGEGARPASKALAESEVRRTHLIFRVDPRWSSVPDDFAAEAPEFWRPRSGNR